ncbi:AAA family ATPase [Scytonema sp. UIC 10036]|uniref:ExeA family protein n=1 Tax=Scytonema sp. UIC 10036 TaxID=2304196 RepID=UPI0012DABF47|nr:AAA family ATPase [Scytonema sp. UIC 10036]MUH00346.1 AAA family ATPase [Scytonema sp. UIC 10036]
MLSDVMNYFGLKRTLDYVGYFETEEQTNLFKELQPQIRQGRLIALSGVVGCGKTTALQRLQSELASSKDIIISRSLAVEKDKVSLAVLMTALFYDLATEKDSKPPTQSEQRERKLLALIQKCRKSVVLFVDEAHDLHHSTLKQIKRLIELARHNGGTLSVLLAGHPKLKNDLRRPSLEEIGARASVFQLEGIRGYQQEYIKWLLSECIHDDYLPYDLITDEAIAFLAERLTTPLQIEHYLRLAFEEGYKVGTKPITTGVIEEILSLSINDLEPRLIRYGYNAKGLANLLNIKTTEVNSFLHGQLPPGRTQDLRDQMLKMGIPC